MKSKIFIALILFAVTVAVHSCLRNREVGRCDFTDAQKKIIPYKKGQMISFTDSRGQTVDFTVTKNELGWSTTEYAGGGFQENYISYRYKLVTLKSLSFPGNRGISLSLIANQSCYEHNSCSLEIQIYSLSGSSKLSFDSEGNFFNYNFPVHNIIEINNKVYYDVVECEFYSTSGYINEPKISMQLYYNKMYGILQIIREGESILTINH